jgi:nicotinamide riboside kinase
MKKIAVIGTHGVGKTTLAHQICVTLKERNINATIIEEKVRSCPFPINEAATSDTDIWMVHTQVRAELEAVAQKYEAAVIDRCSLDAIVYWDDRNTPHPYFEELKEASLQWFYDEYDMIVLLEPSSDTDPFAVDAVRDSGIDYRNRIRDLFREYVNKASEKIGDKLLRVESDEVFSKNGTYSIAVDRVMSHPNYPKAHFHSSEPVNV